MLCQCFRNIPNSAQKTNCLNNNNNISLFYMCMLLGNCYSCTFTSDPGRNLPVLIPHSFLGLESYASVASPLATCDRRAGNILNNIYNERWDPSNMDRPKKWMQYEWIPHSRVRSKAMHYWSAPPNIACRLQTRARKRTSGRVLRVFIFSFYFLSQFLACNSNMKRVKGFNEIQ